MGKQVLVLVGTTKGGFIFKSDTERKSWQNSGIQFKSWRVMHMQMDPRDRRIHAAVSHFVYGPTTHYTDDLGGSWTQARQVPVFPRASKSGRPPGTPEEASSAAEAGPGVLAQPEKLIKVWNITPGRDNEPGVLYAGAEPASLFVSRDRGESWSLNESLFDHPHRATWYPGAGGLCLHTILPDPSNRQRMYVGISTGGCYRTDDGGESWAPYNKNVRADFMPDKFPEYGQCLHKMTLHPDRPEVLYQQNHCGVYRSDNGGQDWIDIGEGKLPTRFGFPVVVHPHDPRTVYVVLEESDEYHLSVGGQFAVWRSRDAGETWEKLTNGLPGQAHLVVLRDAMATDTLDDAGLYAGTNTGQLFYSRDAGDSWDTLADYLPPILSVKAALLAD
jgi:photosystem II stability/assembly factor-like uncharacterized protein